MNAKFTEIHAAADYIGPGAIEVPLYQTEITDLVRRRGVFGQRIKQVPATGHPSRFFEETAIPSPSAAARLRRSAQHRRAAGQPHPRRAQRARSRPSSRRSTTTCSISNSASSSRQFAYLQAKDLADTVDGVLRTHDVALWNGNDTSLSSPTTAQYFGAAGADRRRRQHHHHRHRAEHRRRPQVAPSRRWSSNTSFGVRPTAIYANPVLLDLIDREMKSEFNVVLGSKEVTSGFTVKMLSTQAGDSRSSPSGRCPTPARPAPAPPCCPPTSSPKT